MFVLEDTSTIMLSEPAVALGTVVEPLLVLLVVERLGPMPIYKVSMRLYRLIHTDCLGESEC
jgi:hypothetical protein